MAMSLTPQRTQPGASALPPIDALLDSRAEWGSTEKQVPSTSPTGPPPGYSWSGRLRKVSLMSNTHGQ